VGERARVYVGGGSKVDIDAATYSSRGLAFGGSSTINLFTATDPGTLLDLSSVQSIDAGFAVGRSVNRQEVTASGGAILDLSGLQTVTGPVFLDDWIRFNITDASSTWKLDSLSTVTSAGSGRVRFDVSGGATLSLPQLATIDDADFIVSGASTLKLDSPATVGSAGRGPVQFRAISGSEIHTASLDVQTAGTSFETDGGSALKVGGDLQATGSGAGTIALKNAADALKVAGSFDLGTKLTVSAAQGATREVGKDLYLCPHRRDQNVTR